MPDPPRKTNAPPDQKQGSSRRPEGYIRKEVDPSYHFKQDESLADHEIGSRHIHFDIVLGGDALVTAVKDEGAANSFISSMVANMGALEVLVAPACPTRHLYLLTSP